MAGAYDIGGTDAHVKVSTEDLEAKAGEAERVIANLQRYLNEIGTKVERTSGYWEGEAGTLYRDVYKKQNEVIQEILTDLKGYPAKLLQIAGVYKSSEQTNVGTGNALKSNLL